jgi:RNA polymerase sigma-70 factor (ECF subfamily)
MEDLETYRPLLFSIAYRMTDSASEAEDLVQESFLHFLNTPHGTIHSLKSFLTTIVVHMCLDYLKSARLEREHYIGTWLPEPVLTTDSELWPEASLEQKESLSLAFLLMLETLTPPERAIYLLHEVFDFPFQEIAEIVGKSPAACRHLSLSAGEHHGECPQPYVGHRHHLYSPEQELDVPGGHSGLVLALCRKPGNWIKPCSRPLS